MSEEPPHRITDPRALRALSHRTRWKLIELLNMQPTATATQCADFTGESVASCSYHLGMLAKYGFVEQAGGGAGREKPWRLVSRDQSWSSEGMDPEGALAVEALTEVFLDHEVDRMKQYVRRRDREPEEWRQLGMLTTTLAHLTPEELRELNRDLRAVLDRYWNRTEDPDLRPPGSRPVRLFFAGYFPPTPRSE